MSIFGISENDFLDINKVKIIDGIAGAGKSSLIDNFFKSYDIPYMRCTSTNALRRDAEERYGIKCDTIAGGLFTTEDCKFFNSEKSPDVFTVVIDEILQTSRKTIDWIKHHIGEYNIIITTDTCQMLSQDKGYTFLEEFLEYAHSDDCIYVKLNETKRARDEETKKLYNKLYELVNGEYTVFSDVKNLFLSKKFDEVVYSENDVYICHTKEIEDNIYKRWKLESRYDLPLIPKGNIARKTPKDITRYPICSQIKSERHKSIAAYLQLKNIATPTRYQGSEVTENQTLYYIIEKNSVISNRELYTVLTRCYHMSSLVIVYIDIKRNHKIDTFNGYPVTKYILYEVKTEAELNSIKDGLFNNYLYFTNMINDKNKMRDIREGVYHPAYFKYNGEMVSAEKLYQEVNNETHEYSLKIPKFTARSLIEKESYFDYTFMDEVYRILDDHGIEGISYCHYNNLTKKDKYRYDLDLFSAYPSTLKFKRLPIDGKIYYEYNKNKMNFFLYKGNEFTKNCIITDSVADMISDDEKEYLFSTDFIVGSKMGNYLWEKAHKSVEDKEAVGRVHYGVWQKDFLEDYTQKIKTKVLNDETKQMEDGYRKAGYYVRVESHNHELIMVAICCEMISIIIEMLGVCSGYICVDALHFNDEKNFDKLKNFMKKEYPDLDYRIEDKQDGKKIIYKSYEDLQTKADIKREQARERKRRQRQREKEELKRLREQNN